MTPNSSTARYKRREIPGQLLINFGDAFPFPASPLHAAPPEPAHDTVSAPAPTAVPASRISEPPQRDALRGAFEDGPSLLRGNLESSAAKPDGAPGYKLSGTLCPENLDSFPNELRQLAASLPLAEPHRFVTDARAMALIEQAALEVRPGEIRGVRVRFLPFRATLYSFKMDRARTAAVKFHVAFRRAPEEVILQAARLMLCRVRKIRQTLHRAEYDLFVRSLPAGEFKLPGARRARKTAFGPQGVHRCLEESFRRVNETYFSAQLEQPELCWSPVRARRILGSYQERCDRLIVSRVFDTPAVPLFVLDFLMYHELLHKFLGIGRRGDGRRCMHGAEFKELERKFSRFAEAQAYLKRL